MSKLLLDKEEEVISNKMQLPGVYVEILGTLSIDNEMHDDEVRNSRKIGSRVLFSSGKTKLKQCVVRRRRRVLVFWLVTLVMAFENVRNLLLINHNDGFIDDYEFFFCMTSMHRKTSTFHTIRTHLLPWESLMSLRVWQSFALDNEIYEFWRKFSNPWHDYLHSTLCLWWTRRSLHATKVAFILMQIWRHDP